MLVGEEEADIYGREYLRPSSEDPGWYIHEHHGRCPHANEETGLCDIHEKGKPIRCCLQPLSFDRHLQVYIDIHCIPQIIKENLEDAIAEARSIVKEIPAYRRLSLRVSQDLIAYKNSMQYANDSYWTATTAHRLLQDTKAHTVAIYGENKKEMLAALQKWGATLVNRNPDLAIILGDPFEEGIPKGIEHAKFLFVHFVSDGRVNLVVQLLQSGWVEMPNWSEVEDEFMFKNLRYVMDPCDKIPPCSFCKTLLTENDITPPLWCPKAPVGFLRHVVYQSSLLPICEEAPDVDYVVKSVKRMPSDVVLSCFEEDAKRAYWWLGLFRALWPRVEEKALLLAKDERNKVKFILPLCKKEWYWAPITEVLSVRQELFLSANSYQATRKLILNLPPSILATNIRWNLGEVSGVYSLHRQRTEMPIKKWKTFEFWSARNVAGFSIESALGDLRGVLVNALPRTVNPVIRAAYLYLQRTSDDLSTFGPYIRELYLNHVKIAVSIVAKFPDGYWYTIWSKWNEEKMTPVLKAHAHDVLDYYLVHTSFETDCAPCVLQGSWPLATYHHQWDLGVLSPEDWANYGYQLPTTAIISKRTE